MSRRDLPVPPEPEMLRDETRALLEESPEEGKRVVEDAGFAADVLWQEWGGRLEEAGMDYDAYLTIARGYAGELRLWVVGERPWDHCASGLAGRATRRLPDVKAAETDAKPTTLAGANR